MIKASNKAKWVAFYILVGMGFLLQMIGLLLPPPGEISSGVLVGSGQFITLAGGVLGIEAFVEKSVRKHLKDKDEEDNNEE